MFRQKLVNQFLFSPLLQLNQQYIHGIEILPTPGLHFEQSLAETTVITQAKKTIKIQLIDFLKVVNSTLLAN